MTIGVPIESITDGPSIQWNHIDGPLMFWAGQMHWLTWQERFAIFWNGIPEVDRIACRRFPHLARLRASIKGGERG